jgi:hypothetical protein
VRCSNLKSFTSAPGGIWLILLLAGCAARPVAYVGLYGEYEEETAAVAEILSDYELELRVLDVDPPAGVRSSAVIHGNGTAATRTAADIAYALYESFGTWVAVRPVTITNHSYSPGFIGIYLLSDDYVARLSEKEAAELAVVPTSRYEAQDCENFVAVLSLERSGRYAVRGAAYNDETESAIFVEGTYTLKADALSLDYSGKTLNFQRELQHWSQEPIARDKYVPMDAAGAADAVFSCSFLQELDVVSRQ